MDADAWQKLEKMLLAQRVPRALWPKFERAARYHLLRRRIRCDEDFRRARDAMLRRDAAEKKRRSAFSLFVILLLWLLQEQERQRQTASDFGRRSLLVLSTTDHARHAGGETVERAVACSLLASGFSDEDTLRALDSDTCCPGGLRHAVRMVEATEAAAPQPAPTPTPDTPEPQPEPTDEIVVIDDTDELIDTTGAPTW